jgi:hypothetical protein
LVPRTVEKTAPVKKSFHWRVFLAFKVSLEAQPIKFEFIKNLHAAKRDRSDDTGECVGAGG